MALLNMLLNSLTGEIANINSLSNEFFTGYQVKTKLINGYHYPYFEEFTDPMLSYIWLHPEAVSHNPKSEKKQSVAVFVYSMGAVQLTTLFGIGVFMGPTIGPTLGGFITEHYSWPSIFYINVPIGIAAAVSCYFLLTEPAQKPILRKVDWAGISLLAIGIGTLQTGLERGKRKTGFPKLTLSTPFAPYMA
ncbi:MFS transporter [Mucilaginibacter lappiensis]|uniref:Major facilitator superfamily (MFS) profile domain-containing protein n=1 Tax=Mucilaginibacter lappiensis TaxID=354630 RepID=A0A841JKD9_9SPHI|nr:MFS transporter [Mucilaginibacter lappiensis]MBB6130742.1 hypothetical protein [Mucilaginibacter lappiensis]